MADKNILEQMLSHLVNDDKQKAEELFHEYVVSKSREIYETLIESELEDEDKVDEASDEEDKEEDKVDEASDEDKDDEKMDEEFEDISFEAGNEMGGDPTDDLEGELDAGPEGEEEGEEGEEQLFQDLEAIVDELQAKFDELKGVEGDEMDDGEEGGNPFSKEEGFGDPLETGLPTVREYVEKVPTAKMGDNGANSKSIVAGKNDMGGTTANIAKSSEEAAKFAGAGGGELGGSSVFKGKPTEDNAGNINVPGGKAGSAFSKKEPGHGAEKAGAKESADNKQSLFRGRR